MLDFIEYTMYAWLVDIVETDVRSKTEHQSALNHVGTDHTTGTNDQKLFICYKIHNVSVFSYS